MRTSYTAHRYQLSSTNRRATLDRNGDSQMAELKLRPEDPESWSWRYTGESFSRLELQQLVDMLTDALQDWPA